MTKIKKTLAEIHHKYRSITLYIYIYIFTRRLHHLIMAGLHVSFFSTLLSPPTILLA
jgi:hypothetical protein